MRFRPRLLPVLACFLLSAAALGQSNDEKDIRAIGAQIQSAWNKADAKEIADLFLTDGDYVSSTGRTARGRDELQKAFAAQWSGIYKGTKLSHTLTNVRFLRKDVAIADGAFEITGMRDSSGKILPTRSGLSTVIAAKKGDRWYVAGLRGMVPSTGEGGGK
jgi:uncharacterized protein (TIGR02246 family)